MADNEKPSKQEQAPETSQKTSPSPKPAPNPGVKGVMNEESTSIRLNGARVNNNKETIA
jgi:hypothetical protein